MIDLSIALITYNRAQYLKKTLASLANSFLRDAQIFILNNCSTDSTLEVCDSFKERFTDFTVITHPMNIGGNANILRAYECGNRHYKWILCDDDYLDFDGKSDLLDAFSKKQHDIIIVTDVGVGVRQYGTTRKLGDLLRDHEAETFWTMGFVPAIIFKNTTVRPHIIDGYNNLHTYYQQLFVMLRSFTLESSVYTLTSPLLKRGPAPTGIGSEIILKWILSFKALPNNEMKQRARQIALGKRKNENIFNYLTRYSRFIFGDLEMRRPRRQILSILLDTVYHHPSIFGKVVLCFNGFALLVPYCTLKRYLKKTFLKKIPKV